MGVYAIGLGAADDPRVAAWEANVRARGGQPGVSWPQHITINGVQVKQANAGKLAARFPNGKGGWTYELPTLALQVKDRVQAAQRSAAITAGNAAEVGEKVAQGILDAPRNAISAITGIPRWLIPVVGFGILAFVGADKLGLIGAARRRFATNPRGRRRRSTGMRRGIRRRKARGRG